MAGESCGNFEENFDKNALVELTQDYIDEVDYIIPISGVSPDDFKKKDQKKILGNIGVSDIENKFRFYKKIKRARRGTVRGTNRTGRARREAAGAPSAARTR